MRKEEVQKAVKMEGPEYVPLYFFNKDQDQSDIIQIGIQRHFNGLNHNTSEWGFIWETHDETMGHVRTTSMKCWEELDSFVLPDPYLTNRFTGVSKIIEDNQDRYIAASLGLSGFTSMTCIIGFEKVLEGLYLDRKFVDRLADMVFGFEETLIDLSSGYKFDAISFADDWGTQNSLMISPTLWREFFKPRYKKQFDLKIGRASWRERVYNSVGGV